MSVITEQSVWDAAMSALVDNRIFAAVPVRKNGEEFLWGMAAASPTFPADDTEALTHAIIAIRAARLAAERAGAHPVADDGKVR